MAAKTVLRTSLGLLWVYEGAVLKLAFPSPVIADIVRRSHVYWPTLDLTVQVLGLVQIAVGVWLLSAWRERAAAALATAFMCGLVTAALVLQPSALIDPYGGIPKDVVLFAAGLAIWKLASRPVDRSHVEPRAGAVLT